MAKAGLIGKIRSRLDRLTDYDRRLRERWVSDWARSLQRGSFVLDAGAGDAHLSRAFRDHSYVALDIRPRASRKLPMCCADLHNVPFASESVDHVVSIQVLEHVQDPQRVVDELTRIVRSGGTICLSVPQADGEHEQPNDFFRFTTFSLQLLAKRAGLSVESLRMKGGYFRRLSAELRELPFVVLPEHRTYRNPLVSTLLRWLLVLIFTFGISTLLVGIDGLDKRRNLTTGYFCIMRKP